MMSAVCKYRQWNCEIFYAKFSAIANAPNVVAIFQAILSSTGQNTVNQTILCQCGFVKRDVFEGQYSANNF